MPFGALKVLFVLQMMCLVTASAFAQALDQNPFSDQTNATQQQSQPQTPQQQTPVPTQSGPKILNPYDQTGTHNQQDSNDPNDRTGQADRNARPLNGSESPVPLTPFQRLTAASVGRVLPIFGSTLFTNAPSTFAPVDRIPVTTDYVIGPGDELLIRMWGQVTLDGHFTVDRSGSVYIPQVGSIRVAGVPFAKLTDFLRAQIGRTFKNFDLNVNIGQLRSIQVFVVGQAKRPGSYTVSSLSTLVNALFATGGPSPMGSLRNIQVKRGHETIGTFDLYDLLLKGDKSKDVPLVSGDVIYIPPVGPMVAIAGSVDSPALYEIKSESTIKDAIALAGGLSTLADDKKLRIERLARHGSRSIIDVSLDPAGMATAISDGDILEITPIVDRFHNAVTLRGNVADPRRFAWFPGMRLSDLIPDKDALLTRDYWQKRNQLGLPVLDSTPDVRRYAPDQPVAQLNGKGVSPTRSASMLTLPNALDSDTNVYGTTRPYYSSDGSEISEPAQTQQNGFQQDQGQQSNNTTSPSVTNQNGTRSSVLSSLSSPNDPANSGNSGSSTTVSAAVTGAARRFPPRNAVVLSAPEVDLAYAVIERLDTKDLTTHLIPFNLGDLLEHHEGSQNLALEPDDVVTVFSKADVRVPQSQQTKYVRLEGEFIASGTYSVAPGETLRQLIARVGGITSNAYLYGSQFSRESTRVLQQQRLSEYANDLDRRIRLAEANSANNITNPQDQITDLAALQNARTVAFRLRQLTASGRIVLNIRPDAASTADIPDLALEDGDAFVVPQIPTSVDVFGAVYTQNSFLYDNHRRVGDYIQQAGGPTRTADPKRSYVVRADGSIVSRQFSSSLFGGNFDSRRLFPGDAIIVPEAVDRRPLLRNLVDIATIVGQFGLGIAAINVLK